MLKHNTLKVKNQTPLIRTVHYIATYLATVPNFHRIATPLQHRHEDTSSTQLGIYTLPLALKQLLGGWNGAPGAGSEGQYNTELQLRLGGNCSVGLPNIKANTAKKKKTPFSIPKNIRVYFTIFQSYRSATQNWLLPLTPGLLHWRWRWWAGPFTNLGSPIHMVRQNKYSMILVIRMSNPNHQCIEKNWTAAGKWHQLQYNTCYIHLAVPSFPATVTCNTV